MKLFDLIDAKEIYAFITATTVTDIYYISKKEIGHLQAIDFIENLIEIVDVIGIDKNVIIKALSSDMKDFEDAIQTSAAEKNNLDIILTRNKKDFSKTHLKIATPKEFISEKLY